MGGPPEQPGRYQDGAPGVGDAYFPLAGNGGYDAAHYDLDLRYEPSTRQFRGRATITATATADLQSFHLDLRGFDIETLRVDGKRARYTRDGQELNVSPRPKLKAGEEFTVEVAYAGETGRPRDDGGALYGWVSTPDGAFVANEPEGASTWYPVNDHPTDKATYDFSVTVPQGTTAVANGDFLGKREHGAWTTWRWSADAPMASYLTTAAVGDYELDRSTTPGGLPLINAVDRDLGDDADDGLARTAEMVDFFTEIYGTYPFGSYGAIIDDDSVGYALETQTRPIYSGPPGEGTVAHELAHQWVGNSVSPGRWRDIWLNEGFAVYSTWLWEEHTGGRTAQQRFDESYDSPPDSGIWVPPPGDPGAEQLFAGSVYERGAMTLHALRMEVGDEAFFTILREWVDRNAGGTATTPDLVHLAEEVSGQELGGVFDAWLYQQDKPPYPG